MPTLADCLKKAAKGAKNMPLDPAIETELLDAERDALRENRSRIKAGLVSEDAVRKQGALSAVDAVLARTVEAIRAAEAPSPPAQEVAETATTPQETAPVAAVEEEPAPEAPAPVAEEAPVETAPEAPVETAPEEPPTMAEAVADPDLTGVFYDKLNADLEATGHDPLPRLPPTALEDPLAEAAALHAANPDVGSDAVDDIDDTPRLWKDLVELNVVRIEIAKRKAAFARAADRYFAGKAGGLSDERVDALKEDYDTADKAMQKAMQAAANAQSMWGKAGRASQDLIGMDYSLADVQRVWQAKVNKGEPLTEEQQTQVYEVYQKLKTATDRIALLEAAKNDADAENAELVSYIDQLTEDIEQAQQKAQKGLPKIKKVIEDEVAAARQRLADRGRIKPADEKLYAPILPEDLAQDIKDLSIIGAGWVAQKAMKFGEFSARMVKEFGDWVRPLVPKVWQATNQHFTETAETVAGREVRTPQEVVDSIDPDEGPTRKDVWDIARAHVIGGARGREVLEKVTADLRTEFPEITKDEVAVLFTNYGRVTYPSREETETELNKVRGLERAALKLKDVLAGRPPKRTGFQRGEMDAEVREAEREFRKAAREANIEVSDPERQLKTALGALKSRLRNEIEELEAAIKRGTPRVAPGRDPIQMDQEAADLASRLEKLRADYDAIFKTKDTPMAKRVERAGKALDRRIAEEEQMLKDGVFARPKGEPLIDTPELAAKRERLAELREQRRALDPGRDPLETAKAAATASINRLMEVLQTGVLASKGRSAPIDADAELEAMWEVRKALSDEVRELRKRQPLSAEQEQAQVDRALKAAEKNLARVSKKLRDNDLALKPKRQTAASRNAAVQRTREQVKELNRELAKRRRDLEPKVDPEVARLNRALAGVERQRKEVERRLREKDYRPVEKPEPILDRQLEKAREELNARKRELHEKMVEAAWEALPRWKRGLKNISDLVWAAPRAIMTSVDMGLIGRQGLLGYLSNVAAGKYEADGETRSAAKETLKAIGQNFTFTEAQADQAEKEFKDTPYHDMMIRDGLSITSWRPGHTFEEQEEVYRSRLARWFPGVKWSERSYVTGANAVRLAVASRMYAALEAQGELTKANRKAVVNHVNNLTGRGSLGKAEKHAELLARLMFSPKYLSSRLRVLGGMVWSAADAMTGFNIGSLDTKASRKLIAANHARIASAYAAFYGLLAMVQAVLSEDDEEPPFTVEPDPRSTDFGKIKFSNGTRVDVGAGLLQNAVLVAQQLAGKRKSSMTGEMLVFRGPDSNFQGNHITEILRFGRKKAAPTVGAIVDAGMGKDIIGQKVLPESALIGLYVPITFNEMTESFRDVGLPEGADTSAKNLFGVRELTPQGAGKFSAAAMSNFFGFGTSTYSQDKKPEMTTERAVAEWLGTGIFMANPYRYDWDDKKPKPLPPRRR